MIPCAVRPATLDDLPHLAAIERSAGRRYDIYFNRSEPLNGETLPISILAEAQRNGHSWVAENVTGVIGFLVATFCDDLLHVEELSVAFEHQSKGVGSALLDTAIKAARDLHRRGVSLTTGKKYPWTYPFYQKRGFIEMSLPDCPPDLQTILTRNKANSHDPDMRVAMIRVFDQNPNM